MGDRALAWVAPRILMRRPERAGGGDLALTWLANHLNAHGLGLQEGEIITTGVITEFVSSALGDDIEVTFEHLGSVTVKF